MLSPSVRPGDLSHVDTSASPDTAACVAPVRSMSDSFFVIALEPLPAQISRYEKFLEKKMKLLQ
jgi:hypothetical protein